MPRARSRPRTAPSVRSWLTPRVGVEGVVCPRGTAPGSRRRTRTRARRPPGRTARAMPASTTPSGSPIDAADAVRRPGPHRRGRTRPGTARSRRRTRRRTAGARASSRSKVTPGRRVAPRPGRRTAARCRRRRTSMPRAAEGVGVAARAAADVEHPLAGLEPERVDRNSTSFVGALGERVAQVGRAEVVGEGLEPVVGLGHRSTGSTEARTHSCRGHSHFGGNHFHVAWRVLAALVASSRRVIAVPDRRRAARSAARRTTSAALRLRDHELLRTVRGIARTSLPWYVCGRSAGGGLPPPPRRSAALGVGPAGPEGEVHLERAPAGRTRPTWRRASAR